MESFLTYFPAGEYVGKTLSKSACHIYILDMASEDPSKPEFQLTIQTEDFPNYPFVYYYDASDALQITKQMDKDTYYLELKNSKYVLSKVLFRYTEDFVEITRIGFSSIGPRIRCTKK
ncbi:MAG: hypothetical protein KDD37_03675 [Bdellovibrionales bacterium]|nr:hypothetical protein [Bdellovibrionales bacterium]